tara:strand:- start:4094 stop:5206 length:1113 start_codon:yes stop_codon:yes gene_type:complete
MKIIFGGDFVPGGRWENIVLKNSGRVYSDEVLDFISSSDLRIVNLESPLTTSSKAISKLGPNLKCNPGSVSALVAGGVNLVSLANNHIYDYGKKGFFDTLDVLKNNNINYIGVGDNKLKSRNSVFIMDKVVFLNYGNNEWGVSEDEKEGYNGYDLIDIHKEINLYKKKGLFVCLILHSGHELYSYPSPKMVKEFRFLIDSGSDLIITHHSHFFSGYEKYKQGHIFYGLGNMLFDSKTKNKSWFTSYLLKVKIIDGNFDDFEILPIINCVKNQKIQVLSTSERAAFNEKLEEINCIISNPFMLEQEWRKHISVMRTSYFVGVKNFNKHIISIVNRIPFLEKFLFKRTKHFNKLKNYFHNESHSEVIKSILK